MKLMRLARELWLYLLDFIKPMQDPLEIRQTIAELPVRMYCPTCDAKVIVDIFQRCVSCHAETERTQVKGGTLGFTRTSYSYDPWLRWFPDGN